MSKPPLESPPWLNHLVTRFHSNKQATPQDLDKLNPEVIKPFIFTPINPSSRASLVPLLTGNVFPTDVHRASTTLQPEGDRRVEFKPREIDLEI
jgi:hypothetical protein